jgi:hypothetical protein
MFSGGGVGETVRTRVLVAFGEEPRAYRGVIAAGIRILRPRAEVAVSAPAELEDEIARFGPQVVVCGAPAPADAGDQPAWIELDLGPGRSARVRVGASRREISHPTLRDLLRIVDEAEELTGKGEARAGRERRFWAADLCGRPLRPVP